MNLGSFCWNPFPDEQPGGEMKDTTQLLLAGTVAALVAGTAARCESRPPAEADTTPQNAALVSQVSIVPAKVADLPVTLDVLGTIRARTMVPVGAALPGRVQAVPVREGDPVRQGQLLLVLEKVEAQLRVQQAETAIRQAEKQIEAMTRAGDLEKESLDIGVKQAQAAVDQAKANLLKIERGARPEERKQITAAVEAARTQLEAMQREMQRLEPLYESKVIPKSQLEKVADGQKLAAAQYNAATAQLTLLDKGARAEDKDAVKAAVQQVEAVLELAQAGRRRNDIRALELEAARLGLAQAEIGRQMAAKALAETDVLAPCDGVVQKRNVEAGAIIGPGVPLFMIVPEDAVALEALVTDVQRAQLTPAASARFTVEALEKAGTGPVEFVSSTVDPLRGGYLVRIPLDGNLARQARDGMFCRIALDTGTVHRGAVLVPADAVLHREGRKIVFVVADGKASLVKVSTGIKQGSEVEVTQGLSGHESIVVEGHLNLIDGAAVATSGTAEVEP
jgi:RND family efflux transporter MFP subunit